MRNSLLVTSLPSAENAPLPPLSIPRPSYLTSNEMVRLHDVSASWLFPPESSESEEVIREDRSALEHSTP